MQVAEFISQYQGYEYMTRTPVEVTLVETRDGYLLVRAFGPAGEAFSAARDSRDAFGPACSAACFGDYDPHCTGAFETADGALEHARWLNTLGPC